MKEPQTVIKQRVEELRDLIVLGAKFSDLRKHAESQGWNVNPGQLKRYLLRADKLLDAERERKRRKLFNRSIAQRDALYSRALAVSDYATALRCLQDRDQLLGLYPARQMNVNRSSRVMVLHVKEEVVTVPNGALDHDHANGHAERLPRLDSAPAPDPESVCRE
jgi:hypothetical protein